MTPNELNFSGGPGALPASVLKQTQRAVECLDETGVSLLGMSHRSDWCQDLNAQAQSNLRFLLDIPNEYEVLFLQGGGSLQFAMVAMNFLQGSQSKGQYIVGGYWSAKAPLAAKGLGEVDVIWDGRSGGYKSLPNTEEIIKKIDAKASYLHFVSNETVEGLAFDQDSLPEVKTLICDMSSDLLSKPIDVSRYGLIYAHAQKNLGPAGVTVVIIKKELLEQGNKEIPSILSYAAHAKESSILNTPPVFSIYVLKLVTDWLINEMGDLKQMLAINQAKASCLYDALDGASNFYSVHAHKPYRSLMNIAFTLKSKSLDQSFLNLAKERGFVGLEGHRSIGGLRASLYNAVSMKACERLAAFMSEFEAKHGS